MKSLQLAVAMLVFLAGTAGAGFVAADLAAFAHEGPGRFGFGGGLFLALHGADGGVLEFHLFLEVLDSQWRDHLALMDQLRQGIHLRGYAQKNPKQEYKRESFELFAAMLERIKHDVITLLSKVRIHSEEEIAALEAQRRALEEQMEFQHAAVSAMQGEEEAVAEAEPARPFVREGRKVGRNEPCPCGSGKKYKHCHGKLQ
ncbi:MAG TPA: hypothetical protein ENI93_06685 [Gammaproteobacteria bacterium]|nr:hypothetical protein [Gammaproteobacteria bacterium]